MRELEGLAADLESGSAAIQNFRAKILQQLADAVLTREEVAALRGALSGLRDFEKHITQRELGSELSAMQERLDSLESSLLQSVGHAQRASIAIVPPEKFDA
jgi:hypothetical protein